MKYRRKNSCIKGFDGSVKVEVKPTQVWEQVGRTDRTFVLLENNDVTLIVDKKELCSEWERVV
jgi:hypothetical protein